MKTYWYTCGSCGSGEQGGPKAPKLCNGCRKPGPFKREPR